MPEGGSVSLNLPQGQYNSNWFNPYNAFTHKPQLLTGGSTLKINAPNNNDWVLVITRRETVDSAPDLVYN